METFTDGELVLSIIALVAAVWFVASRWTAWRIGRRSAKALAPTTEGQPLEQENRRLQDTVARLEERIRVLETIATDPSERVALEIEQLR
jgi:type VI protein secretion system component VasK